MDQTNISRGVSEVIKAAQAHTSDTAEQIAVLGTAQAQITQTLQALALKQAMFNAFNPKD
jgi:hypothetical protein